MLTAKAARGGWRWCERQTPTRAVVCGCLDGSATSRALRRAALLFVYRLAPRASRRRQRARLIGSSAFQTRFRRVCRCRNCFYPPYWMLELATLFQ